MGSYIVRRLLYGVLTFFGITIVVFALIHAVPGDPVTFYVSQHMGGHLSQAALDAIRHQNHLDLPLVAQYLYWLRGVVTFDFGTSISDHRPVIDHVLEKMPHTIELNLAAFLLAAIAGVPIGLWSASRSGRPLERASAVMFFLLYSLPSFWVALLLMEFVSVKLGVLPLFGMHSDTYTDMTRGQQLIDSMRHAVLPVITLCYTQLAIFARFSKAALTEVIGQDYITTARAKGAAPAAVLWRHAFRNALIPLITLLGLVIPYLISGSIIVENIFSWDGIGHLYFSSILSRDYPTVLGLTVATAVLTLFASLLADVLYAFADPRIRFEGRR
jgi:peptide/nickel transport system permease protein